MGELVRGWLDSHSIPNSPGDYNVGIPQGGDEKILTWNVERLGEQPTIAQLQSMASFVRRQQQVLLGGDGTLSFEDQDKSLRQIL